MSSSATQPPVIESERPAAAGAAAFFRRVLASPRAPWIIIAVALLLNLPGLTTGWALDDHLHRARIQAALDGAATTPFTAYPPTLWDIFVFVPDDPDQRRELLERGALSWNTDPDLRLGFFRPLSALTHVLDNVLWPDSALLAHAQSLLWMLALCGALWALYRRLHRPGWVAALALCIFALDDAHAQTVAWIANRNALIAATFGVLAFIAYHRAQRDGWRPGRVWGPAALAAALGAGESAVAIMGFLLAYALTLDRGRPRERLLALAPFAAVAVAWMVVYSALGYGVSHSGLYADPTAEPLRFLAAAGRNIPFLLTAQLSGVWSDFALILPLRFEVYAVIGCLVFLIAVADAFRGVLRRSPEARFWLVGTLLAVVPTASAMPADRVLTFVGIGASPLIAIYLDTFWGTRRPLGAPWLQRLKPRVWVSSLIAVHLIAAPLLVPLRAFGHGSFGRFVEAGLASLPHLEPSDDTLVVVANPPTTGILAYAPIARWSRGEAAPGRPQALAPGDSAITITREAANTLLVRPSRSYFGLRIEHLIRQAPFSIGDRVQLRGVTIEVSGVTDDSRPSETRWIFDRPLDAGDAVFLQWSDERLEFVPLTPPAVGTQITLPAVDLTRAYQGK